VNNISAFFAKRFKATILSKLNIYDDLILNRSNIKKDFLPSFDKLNLTNEIILVTNPRLESPAFNAYLFKNSDKYTFTSFSTFASNIIKTEIPLSNYTINASLKGLFDLKSKTIISSCLNILPLPKQANIINLSPRYLNRTEIVYDHHMKSSLNIIFSLRSKKVFQPVFLSNNKDQQNTNLIIGHNTFDHFVLKKINHKFIERLFILYSIIKPSQTKTFNTIDLLKTNNQNDLSILFQTTRTI